MTDHELSLITSGFQNGELDKTDLRAIVTDEETWIRESESLAATELRYYRRVTEGH